MKKLYALIIAISISSLSFAQLTVRNNAYIFVSDEVVFVNDNVNLQEADSKVYLRNEAQLIQGTGTTGNSGIGELSIYQTGTANEYAYNYWCSPVGINSATAGNDNARVNLIDEATNIVTVADPTGLISSSDAGFTTNYEGTSSPLVISERWLYSYVTGNQYSDWVILDPTSTILPGLGFTMKGIGATGGQLYDFRGKPNNGTITNNIAADQFTLIGNPYPSALDALLFIHDTDNTNVDTDAALLPATTGALYYWEQQPTDHFTSNYIGGYASYTISAGGVETFAPAVFSTFDDFGNTVPLPPPGATGSKIARRYIPVGQGFMVEGAPTTPGGSQVFVKNTHRVFEKESAGNSYFFRMAEADTNDVLDDEIEYNDMGLNIVPGDFKRFRINVSFDYSYTRQLVHNFHNSATDGFDYGLEAPVSNDNPTTDASWVLDDKPYVIQAHKFEIEKRIPLVVNLIEQQSIEFSIFDVQNFETSQPIYLYDIENDLYINLKEQNYSISLQAGNYSNRFEITFEGGDTLSTPEIAEEDFDVFQNTKSSELVILNPNRIDIKTVSIYDVSGKRVMNTNEVGNQNDYRFTTKSLSSGVYIASITVANNQVISKKVIIQN
ncbi:T9SS type A sorting domain-containing protein [uncultured Psychroserpens sp.]|uniref:T9SS type A sorting domain-containing protein n=1 Tax=uncultured Psychroserpens sp. TaxID=255436 RepID=UPI0026228AAC|nr:T9SS type A sorting domain-containing protein [uncultured Psychroserpens sp.]